MNTILGIDIATTRARAAVVDTVTGELTSAQKRLAVPTGPNPDELAEIVGYFVLEFDWTGQIGITLPVAVVQGVVDTGDRIDASWAGLAVELFEETSGCPVSVLNDADAAGIAEATFGAGRDREGLVVLTTFGSGIGSGIGSALLFDGDLVPNTDLGSIEVRGVRAALRAAASVRKSEDLSWESWAARVTEFYAVLEEVFHPELLIVGGRVSRKHDRFLKFVETRAEIVPAQLLDKAEIVGAALAASRPPL